jgi:hypothetical protein
LHELLQSEKLIDVWFKWPPQPDGLKCASCHTMIHTDANHVCAQGLLYVLSIYRMRGPRHLRTCAWEMDVKIPN